MTIDFTVASREFFAPLETAAVETGELAPHGVPAAWCGVREGVWRMWHRPGQLDGVDEGWKVHVSARAERLDEVLDVVAAACFDQDVAFKHLSARLFYWWTHQKFAPRPQAGKFIAAYPATVAAAERLMNRLRADLADEAGPYILTDRRFGDSRTVHYRYGSYKPLFRLQPDGTRQALVRDGRGEPVPDRRGVSFHLPDGVTDPFRPAPAATAAPATAAPAPGRATRSVGPYTIESAVRFSSAGGTYLGRDSSTGRPVFIKEGRSHIGLREDDATGTEQLREEWETLTRLHETAPGLAPEPIEYLRKWEHEFLVVERIDGDPLWRWLALNHPVLVVGATPDRFAAYYRRCEELLSRIEQAVARLHAAGYLFVDVSPGNVLVGPDDTVRLVDFGAAHRLGTPFRKAGTPGYMPPDRLVGDDPAVHDHYGLAGLAQLLVGPLHPVVQLNPDALTHLHHELSELAPVPAALWSRVLRYHEPSPAPALPGPAEVAADPLRHLRDLRDRTAAALLAMADLDHPKRIFPTIVEGFQSNTVCVAYGTAGVVHALRQSGVALPDGLLDRLRADALAAAPDLAPGLHAGSAGVARVLADCGLLDEARTLLDAADRHRLTTECATLAGGTAGVALAHLALHRHSGDDRHLRRAAELAAALPPDDELTARLGADDATGLLHGRCGVALMLQQVGTATDDPVLVRRAVRLLHAELDRASDPDAAGLLFPISRANRRAMTYLYSGSAGMLYTTTRCLAAADDERLAEALPRLLAAVRVTFTVLPGLYQGMAGLAFALADHARRTGGEPARRDAVRAARALFKHAIPHETGVRFLGDPQLRFSAELWSGSAGVLFGLSQVLDPRPDGLFAVEPLAVPRTAEPLLEVAR
ncbi:serine/threonine protein kinase [Catellatospora sp. TT07R-123]|uniref:class III lanthionine synthetase LanKC n=1 Tax=Catellatospora sp. TT07R-123 TaxID=2733863 RepID=UPI001B07B202|nr:class III lanthionine synthetase LanKC [Catellatospora sp. TT07R-123]GHJ42807.1 serine/threonine protein kinase [Catellatospora sp. TT07R-123]